MNFPIIENGFLCGWIVLLVILARRNSNLSSILILMLVQKTIDVLALTPVNIALWSGENRHYFYIIHSMNDGLMVAMLFFRPFIHIVTGWRVCFERLVSEWLIICIYVTSIVVNLLVFNEYLTTWAGEPTELFFYNNYKSIKFGLSYAELAILTWLTIQTLIAVRNLRRKGLIK